MDELGRQRDADFEAARHLSDDEFMQFKMQEAAKAIAKCLEDRGRLNQSISQLTKRDLERIADAAIVRWLILASIRLKVGTPAQTRKLEFLAGA